MKDFHSWKHERRGETDKKGGWLDLYGVAVQVVDWMTYSENLKTIVNDVSPHANKFMKVRVGRLSRWEKETLEFLFNKYFPKTNLVFRERDGFYQTEFIIECQIDSSYHYGRIEKDKEWQYLTASMNFACHSEYCHKWKKKHGLVHEHPTLTVFPYDTRNPEDIPEPDWVWIE